MKVGGIGFGGVHLHLICMALTGWATRGRGRAFGLPVGFLGGEGHLGTDLLPVPHRTQELAGSRGGGPPRLGTPTKCERGRYRKVPPIHKHPSMQGAFLVPPRRGSGLEVVLPSPLHSRCLGQWLYISCSLPTHRSTLPLMCEDLQGLSH